MRLKQGLNYHTWMAWMIWRCHTKYEQHFNCRVVSSALGSKPYLMRLHQGHTLVYRAIRDTLKISYKGMASLQLQDCTIRSPVMMVWYNQGIGKVFSLTELQLSTICWIKPITDEVQTRSSSSNSMMYQGIGKCCTTTSCNCVLSCIDQNHNWWGSTKVMHCCTELSVILWGTRLLVMLWRYHTKVVQDFNCRGFGKVLSPHQLIFSWIKTITDDARASSYIATQGWQWCFVV